MLAILAAVVVVVTAPLRRPRAAVTEPIELAELEAERSAKYREIRDAELDRATGKLSEADFHAIDARLRAEALAVLDRIEALAPAGSQVPGSD